MATKEEMRRILEDKGDDGWEDYTATVRRRTTDDKEAMDGMTPAERAAFEKAMALQERFIADLDAALTPVDMIFDVSIGIGKAPPGMSLHRKLN